MHRHSQAEGTEDPVIDRHGEWDTCIRCGYRSMITRDPRNAHGLLVEMSGGLFCGDGRECSLRLGRKRRNGGLR
jgi:hypothetical protein